ncbi:MAG: hypothetical protein RIB53_04035 [Roseitalea porphyridii]
MVRIAIRGLFRAGLNYVAIQETVTLAAMIIDGKKLFGRQGAVP